MAVKKYKTETGLHIDVASDLTISLKSSVLWSTFPAGGGGARRGAILKKMGLKPGIPDILIWSGGLTYCIELKLPNGKVSDNQRKMHKELKKQGIPVKVCYSREEVMKAVGDWGLT